MSGFPYNPPNGTTHTIGQVTWEWNGYAWKVIVSTIGGVCGPRGNTGNTGNTGIGISGATLSNYDLILTLTSGSTLNAGYVRGATGVTGYPHGLRRNFNNDTDPDNLQVSDFSFDDLTTPTFFYITKNYLARNEGQFIESWDDTIGSGKGNISIINRDYTKLYTFLIRGTIDPYSSPGGVSYYGMQIQNIGVTSSLSTSEPEGYFISFSRAGDKGDKGDTGGISGSYVTTVNGFTGAITLRGGTSININASSSGITIGYIGIAGAGNTGNTGNTGATGATGNPSGLYRSFTTTDTQIDGLTIGEIRFREQNIGTYRIGIAQRSHQNISEKAFIDTWDDSTSTVKSTFAIKNRSGSVYGIGTLSTIQETAISGVTYYDIFLNRLTPGVTFTVLEDLFIDVFRTGDCGSVGPIGPQGQVGKYNGLPYIIDGGQTTNFISFGYLSFSSNSGATYIYITDITTSGGGASGYINTFDDSTTTHKGYVHIAATGSDKIHIYNLTGLSYFTGGTYDDGEAIQNYQNYFRLNVSAAYTGGVTFPDGNEVSVAFIRTGDKGADGSGGGSGGVTSLNGLTGDLTLFAGSNISITASGKGITLSSTASGSGAAGTNTYAVFTPFYSEPPGTTFPTLDNRNTIAVLDFDPLTDEYTHFRGMIPQGATFTALKANIYWAASGITGGTALWEVEFEKTATDIDIDSFATGYTALSYFDGLTSGFPIIAGITCQQVDGLAEGDPFRMRIARLGSDASDSLLGDAELLIVEVRGVT